MGDVRFELSDQLRDRSLHGAWWPHSRDAGDELSALDAAAAQGPTEDPADLLVTAGVQDVQRVRPGDLGMYRGTEQ
jgi:hypothetical protein